MQKEDDEGVRKRTRRSLLFDGFVVVDSFPFERRRLIRVDRWIWKIWLPVSHVNHLTFGRLWFFVTCESVSSFSEMLWQFVGVIFLGGCQPRSDVGDLIESFKICWLAQTSGCLQHEVRQCTFRRAFAFSFIIGHLFQLEIWHFTFRRVLHFNWHFN